MKRLIPLLIVAFIVMTTPSLLGQSWTSQTSGVTTRLTSVKAISEQVAWVGGISATVLRTTDGGTTWTKVTAPNADANMAVYTINAVDANTAWVGLTNYSTGYDFRIARTTDGGTTWTEQYANALSFSDGIYFWDANNGVALGDPDDAALTYFVVLTTSDGGANWTRVAADKIPPADNYNGELGVNNGIDALGDHVWFPTYPNAMARVYHSRDRGATWDTTSRVPIMADLFALSMGDTSKGVGVNTEGYRAVTTDGGATWDVDTLDWDYGFRSVQWIRGTNIVLAAGGLASAGVVYISEDGGFTWRKHMDPNTSARFRHLSFFNISTGWVVGDAGQIYKWSGGPVSFVKQDDDAVPGSFKLGQNYPNPFNPSTIIEYALGKDSHVMLTVTDILGRNVATLVNETQSAGNKSVSFDASKLPSGVYFYTLTAGSFRDTKKLLLQK